jgi:hypothetical protein
MDLRKLHRLAYEARSPLDDPLGVPSVDLEGVPRALLGRRAT